MRTGIHPLLNSLTLCECIVWPHISLYFYIFSHLHLAKIYLFNSNRKMCINSDPHQTRQACMWLLQCIRFGHTYAKISGEINVLVWLCACMIMGHEFLFVGGRKHCARLWLLHAAMCTLCINSITACAVYLNVSTVHFDVYLFANLRTCSVHSGKISFMPTKGDVQGVL